MISCFAIFVNTVFVPFAAKKSTYGIGSLVEGLITQIVLLMAAPIIFRIISLQRIISFVKKNILCTKDSEVRLSYDQKGYNQEC